VQIDREDEGHFWLTGVEALPMICGDCGYVALFSYTWLSEDPQKQ
jgi:hypothetical protein